MVGVNVRVTIGVRVRDRVRVGVRVRDVFRNPLNAVILVALPLAHALPLVKEP